MICPYCKFDETKVLETRESESESVTRRRRECLKCKKRFTTFEKVESLKLKVIKKDGSIQEYNREKISRGLKITCEKRLSEEEILKITDEIEYRLLNRKSKLVSTGDIGRMILTRLKNKDNVSYLRFASVFLDFDNVEEFKREIEKLEIKKLVNNRQ